MHVRVEDLRLVGAQNDIQTRQRVDLQVGRAGFIVEGEYDSCLEMTKVRTYNCTLFIYLSDIIIQRDQKSIIEHKCRILIANRSRTTELHCHPKYPKAIHSTTKQIPFQSNLCRVCYQVHICHRALTISPLLKHARSLSPQCTHLLATPNQFMTACEDS